MFKCVRPLAEKTFQEEFRSAGWCKENSDGQKNVAEDSSARIWLEKEPPRSILTWDDLVSKFINQFFPPSKTTNLRNEITRFQQRFDESFYEAWDRFNDLLRACPHHGFSELHQLDTFYNALNANDQDSLNSAAGGNFLDKMPRECLRIIESKSKVRNSRNKAVVAKVSSNSSTPGISPDVDALTTEVSELKNMMKTMLVEKQRAQAPAPVKAVEQSCVTCGGAHSYRNCPATNGNIYQDNIQEYVSQAAAANFNQGNTNSRPPMVANQIRPPGFPPIQNNQNRFNQNQGNNFNQNRGTNSNQNRGNNFYQGQVYQPPTSQPPVYQAQPYQAPAPQVQGVSKTDFENYVKANDAVLRNMQNQGQGLQNQIANLTDMLSKFVNANTASSSSTGTLPSNTVTNPKEDLKVITTRSGVAYKGPTIPTTSSPKVVERAGVNKVVLWASGFGLRVWNLNNRRLDVFGASVISRRHRVLCHLVLPGRVLTLVLHVSQTASVGCSYLSKSVFEHRCPWRSRFKGLVGGGKGLDWVEEGLGKRVRLVSRDVEAFEVVAGKSLRGESLLAAGSGLGRLPRWQLLGLVGCGKGLDWVKEGLGKRWRDGSAKPIPEPHQVQQNDSNVISAVSSVEQSGGIVEQHPANVKETCVLYDSLYNNLAIEVEKVNSVNRKLRETNADLTSELAIYKNQEKCFEINQEKHDKLEREQNQEGVYGRNLKVPENKKHILSGALTHFKKSKDDPKFLPDIVKRGFNQKELDTIIDPMLRQEFEKYRSLIGNRSAESLNMVANIAYRCFQEKAKGRPTMADIVEELEKAYKYNVESLEQRQEDEDNSKMENLKHLKIPFKEIFSATNGFADSRMIGWGGFGGVRKGKAALKRREITTDQGRKEFWKEIDVLSGLNHQNITSLVGFCYEYGEMIIIYDYASNGSFEKYIRNIQNLKWEQRLQICIDTAQGLNYLHNHHIIHRDVKSPNILLGDRLEGMIGDVGLSITVKNTDYWLSNITPVGTGGYVDPKYLKRGILSKQSDMYSFGVVLLEVLCGRFATTSGTLKDRAILVDMAECHLSNNQPSQIIGDYLRKDLEDEKLLDSVKTFAAITHECLHSTETHRLIMTDVLKELKKALWVETILLEEVKSSTDNFNNKRVIGRGASGEVYKGELTLFKTSIPVAVKRLDRARSYGEGAFLKEVVKLSHYVHENIITLRGYCEEGDEKIIIMDHAINGSLDKHLHKSTLTWGLRLKISIGAAKGLNYIHSFEKDQKTVHGNIKSSNILLDHNWKASISDFIISKTHGTKGYLDPQYFSSGSTKETDVYSFGVVLFELLSGKLATEKVEKLFTGVKPFSQKKEKVEKYPHPTKETDVDSFGVVLFELLSEKLAIDKYSHPALALMAAHCFKEKQLHLLILGDIMKQTDAKSIDILSKVAYECLQKDQEKRPTMAFVIQELEKALNIHVEWEFKQRLPKDNENIMKMIEHRESQEITKKDLYSIFSSGIRLNNGKVWLSLSEDGKVKEMISATTFSYENCWSSKWKVLENSRFGTVAKISDTSNLKIPIKIKTQFVSLGIIYGAYLVFKFCDPKMVSSKLYVNLRYRTASGTLNSCIAERRDREWMMIELCRFRSHNQIIDFEVQLKSFCGHPCGNGPIFLDGIEFRPIDNMDHGESVDKLMIAESSVNQDQQLPNNFHEIMTRSEYDVPSMTKQELDKLLLNGVLIDNGEKLFSLSKLNCKKCHMLPAKAVINKSPDAKFTKCPSSTMSRFEEVVELHRHQAFSINCNIETKMLSPDTAYACYLVFQLPESSEGLKCPVRARDLLNKNNKETTIIYLRAPGPIDLYRDKRVPINREDGWMEVRVREFVYNNEIKDDYIPMELKLACLGGTMSGLIICGVEFRPL
ncbi:phloem protein 2-like protein [Tanacetum coccineum]